MGQYAGYAQPNYQSPQSFTAQPQNASPTQVRTNKIFVTGLQDALSRSIDPNSDVVFFDQDKDIMYNIKSDAYGKKTHLVIDLSLHQEPDPVQVQEEYKKQIEELRTRVEALENVGRKVDE